MVDLTEQVFVALQKILPQHGLSRLLGKVANCEHPAIKNALINAAIKHYRIDLSDAASDSIDDYPSFNRFFTRPLKADARPIDSDTQSIASPADGAISQCGAIRDGQLFQAKNHWFSSAQLLGLSQEKVDRFNQGSFFTVYLSPRDYHRVHLPYPGKLIETRYIPGKLFSVNQATANYLPGLFARNERLVCLFETDTGLMAVVLVGAIFVAGINTVWHGLYQPGYSSHELMPDGKTFAKGEEMGQFEFGSTAVVLTEKAVQFEQAITAGISVRMGQRMGIIS